MDQVYAKMKRRRVSPLRRIASDRGLFDSDAVSVGDYVDYSPDTLLEEDQWFRVENFSEQGFFPPFLSEPLESSEIADLTKDQFTQISYLLAAQNDAYCFQRVRPSSLLHRPMITFGDVARIERPTNRIVVNPSPDAVFLPSSDELYFRDLAGVSPMFAGIDLLFREATDEQVETFLGSDFISTIDFDTDKVSKPNRKRIALADATLARYSTDERGSIVQYIKMYTDGNLTYDESLSAFTIASDEDLRTLLYGIEQRFYTTEIGGEKRLANSIIRI
ncbi:hypothetical protein ACTXPS_19200 [Brachybacterium tyrofermentans]|uniref:hypothetical protein n=1 Tax=Brachybacterium tyrofermentans TaxID=47848 RepID=UPI003FD5B08B